jgi:hypothetical protein
VFEDLLFWFSTDCVCVCVCTLLGNYSVELIEGILNAN